MKEFLIEILGSGFLWAGVLAYRSHGDIPFMGKKYWIITMLLIIGVVLITNAQ